MTTRSDSAGTRTESRASAVKFSGSSRGPYFTGRSVAWRSCESVEPHLEPRQDSRQDSHSHALIYLHLTVFRPMTTNTGNCILLLTEAGDTTSECCETHHHGLFTR